jgi:hypothetical protein
VDPNDPSISVTNGTGWKTDDFRPTTNGIGEVVFDTVVTNDNTGGICTLPDPKDALQNNLINLLKRCIMHPCQQTWNK